MLAADHREAALAQEALFRDERVTHYWDGRTALGPRVAQTLKLSAAIAWDTYMVYRAGAIWEGEQVPVPDFWMHQMNERIDRFLNPRKLRLEVRKAIEAAA